MSRKYNPDNCQSIVRAQVSFCGMAVTLVGKHACNWSVCIENANGTIQITDYRNRAMALKEFGKYKRQAKHFAKK